MRKLAQRIGVGLAALVAGLVLAELFLQLALSDTLEMGLWYEPGIHRADERFGFAFREDYAGFMQHRDRVLAVPLRLGPEGFRLPSSSDPAPREDVVFVGGISMMFSYGLPDAESITTQVAAHSKRSLRVWNAAWPGFEPHRAWVAYRERLAPRVEPALAVLCIFLIDRTKTDVPAVIGTTTPERQAALFRFHEGVVVKPQGAVTQRLGALAYHSFLVHKLARFLEDALPEAWLARPAHAPAPRPGGSPPPGKVRPGRIPLQSLLARIRDELRAENTQLLVAFLPRGRAPLDHYDLVREQVPDDVSVLDVHQQLQQVFGPGFPTLGAGHYAPETAREIGRILAEAIDRQLADRDAE